MSGMWRLKSVARTEVGLVRARNEDNLVDRPDRALWAVADGMGGHAGGAEASALIRDALSALDLQGDVERDLEAIGRRLQEIHGRLRSDGNASSGSTIVVLLGDDAGYACLWAGDSRLYRWRAGRLEPVTHDHSLVQELVDSGTLSAEAAHHHPLRNRITRAVGMGQRLELQVARGTFEHGQRLLLSSDGLHGVLSDQVISKFLALPDLEAALDGLMSAVMQAGAPDNVSIVLIGVERA